MLPRVAVLAAPEKTTVAAAARVGYEEKGPTES